MLNNLFLKIAALEDDPLKKYAGGYFASRGVENQQVKEAAIREQIKAQGMDMSTIDQGLLSHMSSLPNQIEIVSLLLPTKSNNFLGVTMYCDPGASAKALVVNGRATSLVHRCGYKDTVIYGDCFIGRCFDDENFEWERRNFKSTEVSEDSVWVTEAQRMNAGKNMNSYSTSGSMQNILNQNKQNNASPAVSSAAADVSVVPTVESSLWEQNADKDQIEIQINVPLDTKASHIKVTFKSDRMILRLPASTDALLGEIESTENREVSMLCRPDGASLCSTVLVDDCTWSLESTKKMKGNPAKRTLVITLAQAKVGVVWPALLRE